MTAGGSVSASFAIRPLLVSDLPAAVMLNNANTPAVNELDALQMTELHRIAVARFAAVGGDGELCGFCLVYPPGTSYASLNYRWFSEWFAERGSDFAYLDRIVVASSAHGRGIGQALYAAVFDELAGTTTVLCCEVNLRPRNQRSLDFHHRLGFVEVGQQRTDGGRKTVSLMTRPIPPA